MEVKFENLTIWWSKSETNLTTKHSVFKFAAKLDHRALGGQVCCQIWPPSARWSSLLLFLTIKRSGFKILSPVWWCFKLWTIKSKCRHFLYNKLAIWDKIYFGNLNNRWEPLYLQFTVSVQADKVDNTPFAWCLVFTERKASCTEFSY